METFSIKNLSFRYPNAKNHALKNTSLSVNEGDFVVLFGSSGSGKTTLLQHLKPALTPHGSVDGHVLFNGVDIAEISKEKSVTDIAFIMQNAENQIVTDKVWHELVFGMENSGYSKEKMSVRLAEIANFFHLQDKMEQDTQTLSGGEKQLLNLASVMTLSPKVLVLDEPTAQLDPVASENFLAVLQRVNEEFGTAVIMSEHRLNDVFPMATKAVCIDDGKILFSGTPSMLAKEFISLPKHVQSMLPDTFKLYANVCNNSNKDVPMTVAQGRAFLQKILSNKTEETTLSDETKKNDVPSEKVLKVKNLSFRYEKQGKEIIKDCDFSLAKGRITGLIGANGSGKSTLLKLLSGVLKPTGGKIRFSRKPLKVALAMQSTQAMFVKETLYDDFMGVAVQYNTSEIAKIKIQQLVQEFNLQKVLDRHPYDVSVGEGQKAALVLALLTEPDILLLDEPTKALDYASKDDFGTLLQTLKQDGMSIFIASHDLDFIAKNSDEVALLFEGKMATQTDTRTFFLHSQYYTTRARRMTKGFIENTITIEEVMTFCKENM